MTKPPAPEVMTFDLETVAVLDLPRVGVHRYAEDPDTDIACASFGFSSDGAILRWRPGQKLPPRVRQHMLTNGIVAAWNIAFDATVWNALGDRHGLPTLLPRQLRCTMARALYWGLPAKLEDAAFALGLPPRMQKDRAGHALMLRMCRPRGFTDEGRPRWWHTEEPARLDQLHDYCDQDVRVEMEIAARLYPLPDIEQETWLLDYEANAVGIRLDTTLINELIRVADEAKRGLDLELRALTRGAVKATTNAGALLSWLQANGYRGKDLRRPTMLEELPRTDGDAKRALRIRLDAARTSVAKLRRMLDVAGQGAGNAAPMARGVIQYYGAGRTGRWAGRLIQPQNFPRGTIKTVDLAVQQVLSGIAAADLEMFHEDSAMGVVSSCLRACLVPDPGHLLAVADLAQIEARVVAWLAGQQDILDVFARGEDVYVYAAGKIGSSDRQLGKVVTLACGFGMGAPKFQATALTYGLRLDLDECVGVVRGWRAANKRIVNLWWDCDDAAKEIARAPSGHTVRLAQGRLVFEKRGKSMLVTLPSGRQLVYRNIAVTTDPATGRDGIEYDGVDQRTRKWTRIRTYGGKLVENFTQAVARDVMRDALHAYRKNTGQIVRLTIHDEAISSVPSGQADARLQHLLAAMRATPSWAPGLPVGAEGHVLDRYRK